MPLGWLQSKSQEVTRDGKDVEKWGTPHTHTHTSLVAVKNGAAWPFLGSPHDPVIPLLRMRRGETKANVHPQTCPGRAKQQHSL